MVPEIVLLFEEERAREHPEMLPEIVLLFEE
jgi:hypothetical protein